MSETVVDQLVTANSNKTLNFSSTFFFRLFSLLSLLFLVMVDANRYVRDLSSHSHAKNTSEKFPPVPPTSTKNHRQSNSSDQFNVVPREALASYSDLFPNQRSKRQAFGKEQLCKSTYQYITPQAALNSQGNTVPKTRCDCYGRHVQRIN